MSATPGPGWTLAAGLALLFAGLALAATAALEALAPVDRREGRVGRRLSRYTLSGRSPEPRAAPSVLGTSALVRTAVELAGRAVARRDLEPALARRLQLAGLPLRPAEWTVIHVGVAVLVGLLAGAATTSAAVGALGLALGAAAPWAYLVVRQERRTDAFLAQLPDVLTVLAGSLQAGYSLGQAVEAVVADGQEPVSGEFARALVQTRLGMPVEDALEGVATRMASTDFAWAVMAVRIQRQVGGNLAELLHSVAGTVRERERLRRHVRALSAEGRLSAWILGLLPPVFALYLAVARPGYLEPLVTRPEGLLLVALGLALLALGVLWLRRTATVEV